MQAEDIRRILHSTPEKLKSLNQPISINDYRKAKWVKRCSHWFRWFGWFLLLAGPGYILAHYFGKDLGLTYMLTVPLAYIAHQASQKN